MNRLPAVAMIVAALAVGPAFAAGPMVHPLSEIAAAGPEFTDLTPTSVTLLLTTSVPVACSAVFGTGGGFGNLSTDTDMAGGAHTSHHPLLAPLEPDTTYQVRMQGTAPDGTLYVSDVYTVHTPAATADPLGTNVALRADGASVSAVSSNYGGGGLDSSYGGDNAIDGNAATQWSSDGDGDAAFIEIDLGRDTAVSGVGLHTRTMGTSAQIESFRVVTDRGETLGPFTIPDAKAVYDFPVDATARRLRFEVVSSSGGNTGVADVAVYSRQPH